jgi:hypothetical protein
VSRQPAFAYFEAETACYEQQHRKKQPSFAGPHQGDLHISKMSYRWVVQRNSQSELLLLLV